MFRVCLCLILFSGVASAGVLDTATIYRFQEDVAYSGTSAYGETETATLFDFNNLYAFWQNQLAHVRDVDTTGTSRACRSLIRFVGIDSIPDWRIVESAVCSLRIAAPSGTGKAAWADSIKFYARQVLEYWRAAFMGTDAYGRYDYGNGGTPTWIYRDTILTPPPVKKTGWTNNGCNPPTSASSTIFDSVTVDTDTAVWVTLDIPASIVQGWIDSTNYGMVIHSAETQSAYAGLQYERTFWSDQADTTSWHPILTVNLKATSSATYHVILDDGDLPYTVTTNYDTVVIVSTVHATDRAITINTGIHDVTIYQYDPVNDTIYWGESGADGMEGIYINNNAYNIEMYDLNHVFNPPVDSLYPTNTSFLPIAVACGSGLHDVTFRDSYVRIAGRGSEMWTSPGNYNMDLRNIKWDNQSNAFPSREFPGFYSMVSIIDMNYRTSLSPNFEYHYKIDRCSTLAANWVNYYFEGDSGKVWIDSCYLFADGRNDAPNVGLTGNPAQVYTIITSDDFTGNHGGWNFKATNNTIRSGNDYAGCEGIGIGVHGADTTEDDGVWIYNNDIQVHKGYDGESSNLYAASMRQNVNNVVIRKNKIYVWGDAESADSSYGNFAVGLRFYALYPTEPRFVADSNDIRATFRDPTVAGSNSTGAFGVVSAAGGLTGCAGEGIWLRYNKISAGTAPYMFGETPSGNDNDNAYFRGDTLELLDSGTVNQWVAYSVYSSSLDNTLVDPYYDSTAASPSTLVGFYGTGEVFVRKTLRVNVVDSNAADVDSARVRIRNAYTTLFVDTTDANGDIDSVEAAFRYYHSGTGSDSTYNPFYIDVITNIDEASPDSISESKTFGWLTSGDVTMIVAPVGGTTITIATPQLIGTGTVFDLLALPRDKSVAQDGRLYIFPATAHDGEQSSTTTREFYSVDSGVTWTGILPPIDYANYMNYHMAVHGQPGRGIHFSVQDDWDYAAYPFYRFMDNPATSLSDTNAARQLSTGLSSTRTTVAARGDTSWVVVRHSTDYDTLAVYMSVDTMKTITQYGRTIGNAVDNQRIGLFTDDNDLPVLFVYRYYGGFYKLPWHGPSSSGFYGDNDSVITTNVAGSADRAFTVCYTDQWHLIYGHDGGSGDYLIHCRDTGTAWAYDTVSYNTNLGSIRFAPKAGVRNDSIFLAFGTGGAGADPNTMWLKIFDPATDTWSADSVLLSGGHTVAAAFQIPSKIPTTFNFAPYFFPVDGSPDSLYFGKINLGASNAAPVVAGIPDQTIYEGGTFTNITLDNYVTDPDHSDALMTWTYTGVTDLIIDTVTSSPFVISLAAPSGTWFGAETITFRVTDSKSAYDEDDALFTVIDVSDKNKVRLRK